VTRPYAFHRPRSDNSAIFCYNSRVNRPEAFSRVKIDRQLEDVGWKITDGIGVRFEHPLPDGTMADYLLCDRHGRGMAVVEAKRASINPVEAEGQALAYAKQLGVPFIFLANGEEVWFWEHAREAHPRPVKTFYAQTDLERRIAYRPSRDRPLRPRKARNPGHRECDRGHRGTTVTTRRSAPEPSSGWDESDNLDTCNVRYLPVGKRINSRNTSV
jgi:hypothetical protein